MIDVLSWPSRRCGASIFGLLVCLVIARPAAAQLNFQTLQVFNGTNGGTPQGPMVQAANGWIYGVTNPVTDSSNTLMRAATVYRFDPSNPAATFETIWTQEYTPGGAPLDGGLVQAGDGNLYFGLYGSGYCSQGRVYRVTLPTTVTVLHEQCDITGIRLWPGLAVGADGALYGVAQGAGSHGTGAVYRLTLDGTFTFAASFPATFDNFGYGQLLTGSDGRLYGTQNHEVYRVDPGAGVVDVLYEFTYASVSLVGRLLELPPLPGHDMAFAGASELGGSSPGVMGYGLYYRIDLSGDLAAVTDLHVFNPALGRGAPKAGLIADGLGNLYGTSNTAIHKIASDGVFSTLHYLGSTGTEEVFTWAPLLLASDGDFYGTTYINSGGPPPAQSRGSVFRLAHLPQTPLLVNAPDSAIFGTSFTATTTGGSGDGALTFATAGACQNVAGGSLITMTSGTGACTITATKAGDGIYKAATSPPVTVTALKVTQTISFAALADKAISDPPFVVTATGGASGYPVTFITTTATVCTSAGANGDTITMIATGVCTVRASQAGDQNYSAAVDVDRSFTVFINDVTPPTVAVTRANGGEKLFTGTPYLIEWTASDNGELSFFDVSYSVNAGSTYNPVPGCTGVAGALRSCLWNSPAPAAGNARIRVAATDLGGNTASDASNADFSITTGTGSITLTSPNSVVDWGVGSTQAIKYSHNLGTNAYVRIEISRDARETWEVINPSFKNTANGSGTFNWVVTGPTVSAAARIRVLWLNGSTISDINDADFSVSDPYVAVTTPATPTALGYGTSSTQKWTTNLGQDDKVDVLLSADDGATFTHSLATNITATKKTANFTTPSLATATNTGRIRVVWTNNANVHGTTPVKLQVHPAYIKVTKPNLAGDGWTVGSSANMTWASNLGTTENVRIELSLDGGGTYMTIVASTASDGTHNVTVQAGWATPTARIRITWLDDGAVSDEGAQVFVIQ